jgi:hypothetical protein
MPPFVSRFPANPYLQLTSSALNLLMTGKYFDVAVGDLELAVAAFVLARLTEIHEGTPARAWN